MKELIDAKNNDTFCTTMLKLINGKEVSSEKYFISNNGLWHKVVREDDKLFHALIVPIVFSKYVLYQAHDALGHNGTAWTYQCLKWLYYWKGLCKDVDTHMKQYIKCRQQNQCP